MERMQVRHGEQQMNETWREPVGRREPGGSTVLARARDLAVLRGCPGRQRTTDLLARVAAAFPDVVVQRMTVDIDGQAQRLRRSPTIPVDGIDPWATDGSDLPAGCPRWRRSG
jgi:hypothetical protein